MATVVKTVQACGTVASHEMGIVFEEKALHSFTLPLLVQEYYNHDSVVFKVFAAHDSVQVVRRPSLRNVDPSGTHLFTGFALVKTIINAIITSHREQEFAVQQSATLASRSL